MIQATGISIYSFTGTPRPFDLPVSLWANADDRLPLDPLGRIEGSNGIVEGSDVADVRPQTSLPDPLDDLTQLGTISFDDKVNSQTASRPRLGRAGDGHKRSSGADKAHRPLRDVTAEDIENQIDPANIF